MNDLNNPTMDFDTNRYLMATQLVDLLSYQFNREDFNSIIPYKSLVSVMKGGANPEKQIQEQIQELEKQLNTLNTSLTKINLETVTNETDVQEKKRNIDKINNDILKINNQIKELREQHVTVPDDSIDTSVASEKDSFDRLKFEHERILKNLKETQNRLKQATQELENAETNIEIGNFIISEHEENIEQHAQKYTVLLNRATKMKALKDRYNVRSKTLEKDNERLVNEIGRLNSMIEDAKQYVEQMKKIKEFAENNSDTQSERSRDLKEELQFTEQQLADSRKREEIVSGQNVDLELKNADNKIAFERQRQDLIMYKLKLEDANTELRKLNETKNELEQTKIDNSKIIDEYLKTKDELTAQINKLELENQELRTAISGFEVTFQRKNEMLIKLQDDLKNKETELVSLKKNLEKAINTGNAGKDVIDKMTKIIKAKQQELRELNTQYENKQKELENNLEEKDKALNVVKGQYEASGNAVVELSKMALELEQQLKNKNTELNVAQEDLKRKQEALEAAKQEIKAMKERPDLYPPGYDSQFSSYPRSIGYAEYPIYAEAYDNMERTKDQYEQLERDAYVLRARVINVQNELDSKKDTQEEIKEVVEAMEEADENICDKLIEAYNNALANNDLVKLARAGANIDRYNKDCNVPRRDKAKEAKGLNLQTAIASGTAARTTIPSQPQSQPQPQLRPQPQSQSQPKPVNRIRANNEVVVGQKTNPEDGPKYKESPDAPAPIKGETREEYAIRNKASPPQKYTEQTPGTSPFQYTIDRDIGRKKLSDFKPTKYKIMQFLLLTLKNLDMIKPDDLEKILNIARELLKDANLNNKEFSYVYYLIDLIQNRDNIDKYEEMTTERIDLADLLGDTSLNLSEETTDEEDGALIDNIEKTMINKLREFQNQEIEEIKDNDDIVTDRLTGKIKELEDELSKMKEKEEEKTREMKTYSSQQSQQPQLGQPQLEQPQLGQPQLEQPQLGQPQLGQPQLEQPQLGQPQLEQPQLGQPQLGQPLEKKQQIDPTNMFDQGNDSNTGGSQGLFKLEKEYSENYKKLERFFNKLRTKYDINDIDPLFESQYLKQVQTMSDNDFTQLMKKLVNETKQKYKDKIENRELMFAKLKREYSDSNLSEYKKIIDTAYNTNSVSYVLEQLRRQILNMLTKAKDYVILNKLNSRYSRGSDRYETYISILSVKYEQLKSQIMTDDDYIITGFPNLQMSFKTILGNEVDKR
jgi:hypothetical protein